MKRRWIVPLCVALALLCALAALLYLWHDARTAHEPVAPPDEESQTPVVETSEPAAPDSEPPKAPPEPSTDAEPAHEEAEGSDTGDAGVDDETQTTAALDPERVAAAWEKVEHIRNNLHLYGTIHPDADAIIAQLRPPPEDFLNETGGLTESGEFIHDEEASERVIALFKQLVQLNDPRTAELVVRYRFEYGAGIGAGRRALVDMGAPSIPFLLDHIKMEDGSDRLSVVKKLKRIVDRHPSLDTDIATYILEPLFEKHKRWLKYYQ